MKKITIVLLCILTITCMHAQSKFSFGLQGGLDMLLPKSEHKASTKPGCAAAFEFGYGYFWSTYFHTVDWGIHTGLSINFASSAYEAAFSHQFTNFDYLNNELQYTTSGELNMTSRRLHLELPIMAAMKTKGFIMHLGVKLGVPVWSQSTQTLSNPNVDAYYPLFDVHVVNELVTGKVDDSQLTQQFTGDAPIFNLILAAKLGYEWEVKRNNALGIMAGVDYNVYNTFVGKANTPLIHVAPITNIAIPIPEVTVHNANNTVLQRIHPLQLSVTFYYSIYYQPFGRRRW